MMNEAVDAQNGCRCEGNGHLAKAIVTTFREQDRDILRERLSTLRADDWSRGYVWLDKSGLEFYFLARLKELGIEDAIPRWLFAAMEHNFAANKVRTARLFEEFVRINEAFQREQLNYCNVLGVSHVPISCPDPALRRQISLDFLVASNDPGRCDTLLAGLGYGSQATGERSREYRPLADGVLPGLTIYESFAYRSIGVYFLSAAAEGVERAPYDMLMRRRAKTCNGHSFPALTECDHFIAQAIRMLGHVGIEWTRLAFLLEFSACIRFWMHDATFWDDVLDRGREHPLRPIAIGTAMRLAAEIFGTDTPPAIRKWAEDSVDTRILQWSRAYSWDALLADFPGTTLLDLLDGKAASSPLTKK